MIKKNIIFIFFIFLLIISLVTAYNININKNVYVEDEIKQLIENKTGLEISDIIIEEGIKKINKDAEAYYRNELEKHFDEIISQRNVTKYKIAINSLNKITKLN